MGIAQKDLASAKASARERIQVEAKNLAPALARPAAQLVHDIESTLRVNAADLPPGFNIERFVQNAQANLQQAITSGELVAKVLTSPQFMTDFRSAYKQTGSTASVATSLAAESKRAQTPKDLAAALAGAGAGSAPQLMPAAAAAPNPKVPAPPMSAQTQPLPQPRQPVHPHMNARADAVVDPPRHHLDNATDREQARETKVELRDLPAILTSKLSSESKDARPASACFFSYREKAVGTYELIFPEETKVANVLARIILDSKDGIFSEKNPNRVKDRAILTTAATNLAIPKIPEDKMILVLCLRFVASMKSIQSPGLLNALMQFFKDRAPQERGRLFSRDEPFESLAKRIAIAFDKIAVQEIDIRKFVLDYKTRKFDIIGAAKAKIPAKYYFAMSGPWIADVVKSTRGRSIDLRDNDFMIIMATDIICSVFGLNFNVECKLPLTLTLEIIDAARTLGHPLNNMLKEFPWTKDLCKHMNVSNETFMAPVPKGRAVLRI